ncbi:hypothetical protein [Haloglomus salinum]|jgi:hypothetical protein|uniref:hypothetical protein n=1 Tax=Haloglomus salinum TaxID=2962673 RepID=UPI0020C9D489|nr:hypothetical protein [Haloglomus salinum]
MTGDTSPTERTLHPHSDHGILECPDCATTILGDYQDLKLHYLDAHFHAGPDDEEPVGKDTLVQIKRAQEAARRED